MCTRQEQPSVVCHGQTGQQSVCHLLEGNEENEREREVNSLRQFIIPLPSVGCANSCHSEGCSWKSLAVHMPQWPMCLSVSVTLDIASIQGLAHSYEAIHLFAELSTCIPQSGSYWELVVCVVAQTVTGLPAVACVSSGIAH